MPSVTSLDGPVAVTGASGYVGSHTVTALIKHGYVIRACVTDTENPDKTKHLLSLNVGDYSGRIELFGANLLDEGSYDEIFSDCCAVLHVGTPMGYANVNNPQQVYDGAIMGTNNVMKSVRKAGTVKRFIYTSSFAAIGHPAPSGYRYTEKDWASDNREEDPNWSTDNLNKKGEVGYAIAKVELEHLVNKIAEEDGNFESISVCPIVVLGPLLSKTHELAGSWQWHLGRMLAGKICQRGWQHLWNIVDVRDVGESQVLMIESEICRNGDRYLLSATNESGEIDVLQLQRHLQKLFPDIEVAGAPEEIKEIINKYKKVFQAPLAHCDKARTDLGLKTHPIEDTLYETGSTMIDLGLVKPKLE